MGLSVCSTAYNTHFLKHLYGKSDAFQSRLKATTTGSSFTLVHFLRHVYKLWDCAVVIFKQDYLAFAIPKYITYLLRDVLFVLVGQTGAI